MRCRPDFLVLAVLATAVVSIGATSSSQAEEWPTWRGPTGNGVAPEGQKIPLTWSETENVLWKIPIPGRGHSSPTIVEDRLLLTTADEKAGSQSMLCVDLTTQKIVWQTEIRSGLPEKIHKKNTHASGSVACDGERAFAVFMGDDKAIHLASVSVKGGDLQWVVRAGGFESEYPFGYGASPMIWGDTVIASADSKKGWIAAFDKTTGKEVWKTDRHLANSSYSSPILSDVGGREQILLSGGKQVASYDPETGKQLWLVPSGVATTAGTMVWNETLVFASGGYPTKATWAIDPSTKKVVWQEKAQCYEQSMLLVGDQLYGVAENGMAYCWDAATGNERWRERLGGGAESASPTLAGGHIYATNERGHTFVLRPDPDHFEVLHTNQLGDEIFASPTIVNNRIYIRSASYSGNDRQETLYCIGFAE